MQFLSTLIRRWTTFAPIAALVLLVVAWGWDVGPIRAILVATLLALAVFSAVHHAEVVAHRVGEPFGSLILAVAVTVIEVGLIVMLMLSADSPESTLARDTVFAAFIITCNGIVGLSILMGSYRFATPRFNAEGTGGALATVAILATICLVLPTVTESANGQSFSSAQLAFAAIASVVLWSSYVFTQTVRHRDFFLPVDTKGKPIDTADLHADPPTLQATLKSLALLICALVAVVGLAKILGPTIESGVAWAGMPYAVVGVVIAMLVLLPESIAAVRAAMRNRTQVSLNLAYGSGIASIGLTVPTIALLSPLFDTKLVLGLDQTGIVLVVLTVMTGILTVVPGRATRLQGVVHLVILGAYVFFTITP